jgi:hypothetical protein
MTRFQWYRAGLAVVATLGAVAACGGHPAAPTAAASAAAPSDEQILATGRQYAQCLRDHGITGVTEPRVENGRLQGAGVPADYPDAARLDAAFQACQPIMDRLPAGAIGSGNRVSAGDLERLGRWAACIRQHGVPQWPDPDGEGLFPVRGTETERVMRSDQFRAAERACQQYYDGVIKTVRP